MTEPEAALKSAVARLSPRERECLRLVAQHMRSKEIGRRLGISSHTVDGHINEARRRLEAIDRREVARMVAAAEALGAAGAPLNDLGGAPSRAQHPPVTMTPTAPSGSTLSRRSQRVFPTRYR